MLTGLCNRSSGAYICLGEVRVVTEVAGKIIVTVIKIAKRTNNRRA